MVDTDPVHTNDRDLDCDLDNDNTFNFGRSLAPDLDTDLFFHPDHDPVFHPDLDHEYNFDDASDFVPTSISTNVMRFLSV